MQQIILLLTNFIVWKLGSEWMWGSTNFGGIFLTLDYNLALLDCSDTSCAYDVFVFPFDHLSSHSVAFVY